MSQYEKRALRQKHVESALAGRGLYIFENISKGDLWLPKPDADGSKGPVPPGGQWKGDDYFTSLLTTRDAKIVKILVSPQEQQMPEKLIVDQPDRVTNEGTVEQVVKSQLLTEVVPQDPTKKGGVLINEDPMAGVEILLD